MLYTGAHRRFDVRAHYRAMVCLALTSALVLFGFTAVHSRSVASAATPGTVAGTVFEDYDANGLQDGGSNVATGATATDRGIAGATVTISDSSGSTVGSTTTNASGAFSVAVSAATSAVRVEVTPPSGYTAGPHGTGSTGADTTVQFVTLGTAAAGNVLVSLVRTGDYAQDAPPLLAVEQVGAIGSGTNSLLNQPSKPTLVATNYDQRGTQAATTISPKAYVSQTGSIWGVAQLNANYAFTAAALRRHAAVGPGGMDAIYVTDLTGANPNATVATTISGAGADPRTNEASYTFNDWFHDTAAYPAVGTVGFGGMAITPDHKYLYVVSLGDKKLYRLTITQGAGVPSLSNPTAIALPTGLAGATTGCAATSVRPFGVTYANGALWTTLTCTGPNTADLRGYVYRYDLGSGTFDGAPAYEAPMAYTRGNAYSGCGTACSATWNSWTKTNSAADTTNNWPSSSGLTSTTSNTSIAYPEPLLSSVAFDANGDMSIGIKDRFADQVGYEAGNLITTGTGSSSTYEGFSAGDVIRACLVSGSYVQESNGSCGSRTGYAAGNSQGPGGGEFYNDDFGGTHPQTALGALLQLPGYGQLIGSNFDAGSAVRTEGYRFWNNTNGANNDSHTLIDPVNSDGTGKQGSFSKAGGLGELAALVTAAPIEIGNRVWTDTNGNGLQDAGEPSLSGVTVELAPAAGGAAIATATTDSNGEYYFSNGAGTSTASAIYGVTGLNPNTAYTVRIPTAQFAGGAALSGYTPTRTAVGSDRAIDSNGARADTSSPDAASVTTGDEGSNDHTIDFGVVQPVSVGDFVWQDTNHDGIQQASEPGIPNVTVTIGRVGGGTVLRSDGTPLSSTTAITDANGKYSFTGLAPGQYVVTVSPPAGFFPTLTGQGTTATDSSTGTATSTTLTSGQSDSSLDFGFFQGASLGNFVWNDINRNGVQDANEPGIPTVSVTLTGPGGGAVTDLNGVTVGPASTDANGFYSFPNLPLLAAGQSYTVHVNNAQTALAGQKYAPTQTGQGTTATDSSNSTAVSGPLTTSGATDQTLDFGFYLPAVSVGDFVWNDLDGNGLQDTGEPGIPGVTVTLTKPGGGPVTDINGKTVGPDVTDQNGLYSFTGLPTLPTGQSYTAHVANGQSALTSAGYVPTTARAGGNRATDSDTSAAPSTQPLTTDGATDFGLDFGFVAPASVGDFVWDDVNGDGVQQPSESGIQDVQVTLSRTDGNPVTLADGSTDPDTVQTTDANGKYDFTGLAPGAYTVTVTPPNGFVPTKTGQGTPATDSSTGSASTTLTSGASDQTLDFGFLPPAVSVGDFVWEDTNRNGVQDAGESGIQNVTVTITAPGGGAVHDTQGALVGPATTDANGEYEFLDLPVLPAGQGYTVHVDGTQSTLADAGYTPTLTGQGTTATDSSTDSATSGDLTSDGDSDDTLDFGFVTPAVSVGDFVWQDLNGNGVQDNGEPGIQGVTVTLSAQGGGTVTDVFGDPVGPTTTDIDGAYHFRNLPRLPAGGYYTVRVDNTQTALAGAGLVPTKTGAGTPATDSSYRSARSATLTTNGQRDDTLDFGFLQAVSVGDFVWNDTNGNGIQDTGETGIQGVTVTITQADGTPAQQVDGTVVTSTTTNVRGRYLFGALEPGRYTVTVQLPSGYYATKADQGSDPALDSSTGSATSSSLASGMSDLTLDFGVVQPAGIGNFVWQDTDRDGIQDGTEVGLAGATVTLTDASGNPVTDLTGQPVDAITTDSSGAYTFGNLPPGTYTVTVTPPTGWDASPANRGGDTTLDSSSSPVTDTITSGQTDQSVDFGFTRQAVSVGDYVWFDQNGDGVQQSSDTGIGNVTVSLTGPGNSAVTDVNGVAVAPRTTDANGAYTFTDLPSLPAGQHYTVSIDNAQAALSGYYPTLTGQGTTSTDSSTDSATSGNLTTNGASDTSLDFGFVKPVSVGDYVWFDANGNGVQDSGEDGIEGVTLTLSSTSGGAVRGVDGTTLTGAALRTTTDSSGEYNFGDLFPGRYTVSVTTPSGYTATTAGAGSDTTVDSSSGSADGRTLRSGQSDDTLDFGFVKPVSVGDYVWFDANHDGVQQPSEAGIAGVVMRIATPNGDPVLLVDGSPADTTTTTDSSGHYAFDGLAPGRYVVSATTPAGYVATLNQAGNDRSVDSSTGSATSALLAATDADDTLDFGFVSPVSVGDFVWLDANHDGVQDPSERGIPDVTVTLTDRGGHAVRDASGALVAPQTTDATGHYEFTNLPPGRYVTHVDDGQAALAAYLPTTAGAGGDRAADSSTGSSRSRDVPPGQSDDTLDFGFYRASVSVGNYVWLDANRDGRQDASEHGIAGVVLRLRGPNGKPVHDVDGKFVGEQITDADGHYLFGNLPLLAPGQHYTVSIDATASADALAGYTATTAGVGSTVGDSSTRSAESASLDVGGTSDRTLDFGFVRGAGQSGAGHHRGGPHSSAPTSTAPQGSGSSPAFTGTPVGQLVIWALVLLLVGGAVSFAGLRRRPRGGREG